jgi:uncharacterized protein (TIGR03546 family)
MLLLKLLQQLIRTLNSEGTPGQVAAGVALGACLGLTPIANLHNLGIFALICLFNVSFPGAMLGWALFVPIGFLLDPVFDALGSTLLLDVPALTPLWTSLSNMPVVPLFNFNNTVVLGSFLVWFVMFYPIYLGSRWGVAKYREKVYARLKESRFFQAVAASKLYNFYRLFRP